MNTTCAFGGTCVLSCIALCLGWLLASSALVYYTWNKVICTVTSLKKMKYWQPFLLLVTICVLLLPCSMRKGCHQGKCAYEAKHSAAGATTAEVEAPKKK